jgi:putative oxidoreductase
MYHLFFSSLSSPHIIDLGILVLRIGIGTIMAIHGYGKLMGGMQTWEFLGAAMQHIGISFWPVAWGLAAACTEFFGGIALITGFGTRLVSLLLAFVMLIAFVMHYTKGDPFRVYSHALSLLIVFIALAIMAGGRYSIDAIIHHHQ